MEIYLTTNNVNGKKYVGMLSGHKKYYLGSGKLLTRAIQKYGKENFTRETLEFCSSEDDLRIAEQKWISHFDAVNNPMFYNLCEGGRGGNTGNYSSMSDVVKKTWDNYTEEEKKNRLGDFGRNYDKSGKNNPMYGRSAVTEKNLKWYTNGVDNLYVTEGTQPSDYRRGRTVKRRR